MPEEIELDAREQQEKLEEIHRQQEEPGTDKHASNWARLVSLSTAVLAVIAAVAALHSGTLVNEALLEQGKGTQAQAKASDAWAYYQAKSLKQNGAEQTAAILAANPATRDAAARYEAAAKRYDQEKADQMAEAKTLEKERDEANKTSAALMNQSNFVQS